MFRFVDGETVTAMLNHARAAGRAAIFCGVAAALSPAPLAGQAHTRPDQSVFGVYGRLTAGQDSIRVAERANGKIN